MRRVLRRALLGAAAGGLAIVLGAPPVTAGVGTRLVNGDGDTSGKCLSIENTGRGSRVLMETCTTNAHQGWYLQYSGGAAHGPYFKVRSQDADARGKCLTPYGQGQQVYMAPCIAESDTNVKYQRWWVDEIGSTGWYQFENDAHGTNQCLDVRAYGESNMVQTWACGPDNQGNQKWKFW